MKDKEIELLQSQVSNLVKNSNELTERLDQIECREREDSLVISGPNVSNASAHESIKECVSTLLKSSLKYEFYYNNFLNVHRIDEISASQKPDKRSILVGSHFNT